MNRRQFLAAAGLLLAAPTAAVEAAKKREDDLLRCRLLMEWLNHRSVRRMFAGVWAALPYPPNDIFPSSPLVYWTKYQPRLKVTLR